MLGKIIEALMVISLFVVFILIILIYFSDGNVKDLVFWGIILLFNYIGFLDYTKLD